MKNIKKKEWNYIDNLDEVMKVDLALELSHYKESQLIEFCTKTEDFELSKIIAETDKKTQVKLVNLLGNGRIIKMFSFMAKDSIVDILLALPKTKSDELLSLMDDDMRKLIRKLMTYSHDCAGGIMTTEYIKLGKDVTVGSALSKVRVIALETSHVDVIYVVDDDNTLLGTVELRDAVIEPNSKKLEEIMNTNFIYVEPETDQEQAALLVSKYNLKALPVLNRKMVMQGIITIDDIVDVLVIEHTEDMLRMGGVDEEENIESSIYDSIKSRLPWLLINLVTAFFASMTVKAFESTIAQVVALSSIMSIIAGMGGNSGNQTVSIIIRSIAMGKVQSAGVIKLLKKEFIVGLTNGLLVGLVAAFVVTIIYRNYFLGLIVLLAMICNLIISCVCGLLIPITVKKLNIDPALSSSIVLTTATDVLGFFVFLSLAKVFLPFLL